MTKYFTLSLDVVGPMNSAGFVTTALGIDTSVARNFKGGIILPGTLVKGAVLDILKAMSNSLKSAGKAELDLEKWFGSAASEGSYDPRRELVNFSDLLLTGHTPKTFTRIAIDDQFGAVKSGALQVIESPLAIGESGKFCGTISIFCDQDAKIIKDWIEKALRLLPALGGVKGAGFGALKGFQISEGEAVSKNEPRIRTEPEALRNDQAARYVLMFDEPFLVGAENISGNIFKGATIIPGAAIKGALADQLARAGKLSELANDLDKIIFRHAKPVKFNQLDVEPQVIPLSIYSLDEELADSINKDATEYGKNGFVCFQDDWKPDSKAKKEAFRLSNQTFDPQYDIRTRTAIKDNVADDAKLFTYISVCPDDHHVWSGQIIRGNASKTGFETILNALNSGIEAIGKTGARAQTAILTTKIRNAVPLAENRWRLVLQTHALLHNPDCAKDYQKGTDFASVLKKQYLTYFQEIFHESIQLDDYFAQQTWVGNYQAKRFKAAPKDYTPQLLTLAGSVFIIKSNTDLNKMMTEYAQFGLPLPKAIPESDLEYKRSAFNRENGYGEITVDANDFLGQKNG